MNNLRSKILISILLLSSILFVQCKTTVPSVPTVKLEKTTWYFKTMTQKGASLTFQEPYALTFDENTLSIKFEKNSCQNGFLIKGNQLILTENSYACTKVCCDGDLATTVKAGLVGSFEITKTDTDLKLIGEGYSFSLVKDKPAPPIPKQKLENTTWKIKKVFSQGSEWAPKTPYTLNFTTDGVNIRFEKNSCTGNCSFKPDQIIFAQEGMACTEICCDSEEAQKLYYVLKGTMQYAFEGETLIIFAKMVRLYLSPTKANAPVEEKPVEAKTVWGKTYQIYDVSDKRNGVASANSNVYMVSFEKLAFKIKLDVNTCSTTATYVGNSIEINEVMGCTKACCDTAPAKQLANYFKGSFTFSQVGEYLKMSSDGVDIRLKIIE